jgi:hypothetical protein
MGTEIDWQAIELPPCSALTPRGMPGKSDSRINNKNPYVFLLSFFLCEKHDRGQTMDKPWNDLELSWNGLELSWNNLELS